MKKRTVGVIIMAGLIAGTTVAQVAEHSEPTLTQQEQRAYEAAHASWARLSKLNEEIGLPPLPVGNEPLPGEFIGVVEKREAALAAQQAALEERRRFYADKLEEGRRNAQRALQSTPVQYRADRQTRQGVLAAMGVRKLGKQWEEYRRVANAPMDVELRRILSPESGLLAVSARNGLLEVLGTDNVTAADTIHLDELWPGGASTLPDVSGAGRLVGVWEAGGGVFADHDEFQDAGQSRVTQIDDPTLSGRPASHNHATQVAGTIAAAGFQANARGGAFDAEVAAYDSVGDIGEMALAVSAGLELSNHSYSLVSGWRYLDGIGWTWFGRDIVGEDPQFGIYTEDSREVDILAYESETYLPVFSSGNEVTEPGPVDVTTGLILPGTLYLRAVDTNGDGIPDQVIVDDTTHPSDGGAPLPGATPPYPNWPPIGPGYDTLKPRACAKNNLAVGAIEDIVGGFQNPNDAQVAAFSSHGPTDDGRIKPDIVANGVGVITADYDVNQANLTDRYTDGVNGSDPVSGTSYSTPSISGMLAGIQELHESLGGEPMWASSLKAAILGTADDAVDLPNYIGLGAVVFVGPDYFYGWGVANAERVADLVHANDTSASGRTHLRQHVLFDGNTVQIPVEWDGASPDMRITLAWTDPAFQGVAIASAEEGVPVVDDNTVVDDPTLRLINDLDIRITTPGSATLEPWVLDPANPDQPATTGDNFRDNVEQIVVDNPVAGTYTITISHKGSLRAAHALEPGHPQYDPDETRYELATGQFQSFSLAIEGNQELVSDQFALTMAEPIGDDMLIEWQSAPGLRYQVETTTDLTAPNWAAYGGPVDATGQLTPFTITGPLGDPVTIYRVSEVIP